MKSAGKRGLTAVKTLPAWRERLISQRKKNGFLNLDTARTTFACDFSGTWPGNEDWGFPKGGNYGKGRSVVLSDGILAGSEIRVFLCSNQANETDHLKVRPCEAVALRGNKPVAHMWGTVVQFPTIHIGKIDFFEACDHLNDANRDAVGAINQMIEPNKLADMGDLLILFGWEKAGDRMQAGAGLVFLTETLKCLRKMVSNLKVIATDLHPFQFMDIRYDRRIVHRDFKEARKILRSYWDKVKPELALDKDAECLIYDDMNATVAAAPQLAGERLSAAARLVRCKDTQNLSAVQRQANSVR